MNGTINKKLMAQKGYIETKVDIKRIRVKYGQRDKLCCRKGRNRRQKYAYKNKKNLTRHAELNVIISGPFKLMPCFENYAIKICVLGNRKQTTWENIENQKKINEPTKVFFLVAHIYEYKRNWNEISNEWNRQAYLFLIQWSRPSLYGGASMPMVLLL